MTEECVDFLKTKWDQTYEDPDQFNLVLFRYLQLKTFAPHENVKDKDPDGITDEVLFILRNVTQFYLTKAFEAMKIDLDNPNVTDNIETGNIGTPGRIAKIWCGANINDDRELGGGRFSNKPRMARFPSTKSNGLNLKIPITKKVDIISNCSHHFIPFSSIADPNSYAIISYIPENFVLGISKLQRITDWICQRFWLQEDLTKKIYEEVCEIAETDSVYVRLHEMRHGCETFRGSKSKNGSFTSECYGGMFETEPLLIPQG